MQDTAATWLMTALTSSPLLISLMQTAAALPVLLFGLPAGAMADIIDRRRLLLFWGRRRGGSRFFGLEEVAIMRALVRAILDHPEGFRGEVVICENTQFLDNAGFDRAEHFVTGPEDAFEELELLREQLEDPLIGGVVLIEKIDDDDVMLLAEHGSPVTAA